MVKGVLMAAVALLALTLSGCQELIGQNQGASSAGLEIVRSAELGTKWQMKQVRLKISPGQKLEVLLRLSEKDEVDGYFFVEKGSGIDFAIAGRTQVYRSPAGAKENAGTGSDRFSFTATREQGDTYTLTLDNPAGEGTTAVPVFLEVIYPVTGSLYVPVIDK
ncbi:MAG: hypothetical protein HYX91_02765 [Chloroflexi bacterium]|nr:hypothetical protein [Chloroflexota bacterium]